ncbi:MAG: hypothetical protein M1820_000717 [Bogoriella megaspora]|nr:MAG: hypothetical protein M1820_000717 [Bogoriella megaspora]
MSYETQRLANIARNESMLKELGLQKAKARAKSSAQGRQSRPPTKKRKLASFDSPRPTRISSRIAAIERPSYSDEKITETSAGLKQASRKHSKGTSKGISVVSEQSRRPPEAGKDPHPDIDIIRSGWADWKPSGASPTRDTDGTFHFSDFTSFTPNKSPAEILREGCFGGSYFRPLYSRHLGITISEDWRELPDEWIEGLDVERFVASPVYDAEINKYKVACGQSIEEWEAAGWINHTYDVRGWFQWYCRFFLGRRCDDDERQVGRWKKCVGETGRWRRLLLKKYRALGVRTVWDDGEDEDGSEVSPVMHQTCHHWAWEIRQEELDRLWAGD